MSLPGVCSLWASHGEQPSGALLVDVQGYALPTGLSLLLPGYGARLRTRKQVSTYSSPFLVNLMCMDSGTLAWFYAREAFVSTGDPEAYDKLLGYVTLDNPLPA